MREWVSEVGFGEKCMGVMEGCLYCQERQCFNRLGKIIHIPKVSLPLYTLFPPSHLIVSEAKTRIAHLHYTGFTPAAFPYDEFHKK